jgi:hypothetical protein
MDFLYPGFPTVTGQAFRVGPGAGLEEQEGKVRLT